MLRDQHWRQESCSGRSQGLTGFLAQKGDSERCCQEIDTDPVRYLPHHRPATNLPADQQTHSSTFISTTDCETYSGAIDGNIHHAN